MERDKETELSVEECLYFWKAAQPLWAKGITRIEDEIKIIGVAQGEDVRKIFAKTDDGWDWIDFERFSCDPLQLKKAAYEISKLLSVDEIALVRKVARKKKRLQRKEDAEYNAFVFLKNKKGIWWARNLMTYNDIDEEVRDHVKRKKAF